MSGEVSVAVLDGEAAFVDRLTGYVNKKGRNGIRLTGFTNSENLKEYLKTNRISAVLCNQEAEGSFCDEVPYLLVFERDIRKYQAADMLMEEIKRKIHENMYAEEATINVSAVCAANAGYKLEELGRQIAEGKASKGKTILINLFPFFKSGIDLGRSSLSEVIYQIRRNAVFPEEIVFSKSGKDEFDVLEGVDYWGDISVMTDNDMRTLVASLGKKCGYKNVVIVFDLLMPVFETILELSSNIYCPEPDSMFEEHCFEEMKRQIGFVGQTLAEKIVICRGSGYKGYERF